MSNSSESSTKQTPQQADLGSTYHSLLAQRLTLLYRRPGAQEGPSGFSCICLMAVLVMAARVGGRGGGGGVEGLLAQLLEKEARRKQDGSITASPESFSLQGTPWCLGLREAQ